MRLAPVKINNFRVGQNFSISFFFCELRNFKVYPFFLPNQNNKDAIFYLIGVHPEFQSKGIHALIFNEYQKTFEKLVMSLYVVSLLVDHSFLLLI